MLFIGLSNFTYIYNGPDGGRGVWVPTRAVRALQRGSVSSAGLRAQDVLIYLELGRSVREALHIPESAQDAFAFWLCSPLLELQLKPKHQPYKLCRQWQDLLYRFTEATDEDISQDEPCLQYRRNVFYHKAKELEIEDEGVLRLLYDEAKANILEGRYPCDPEHWLSLGVLSCAFELGVGLDAKAATAAIRKKKLASFLPAHLSSPDGSAQDPTRYLRQYLSTCHSLPYYGCAFFSGEIDKPVQGILQRGGRKTVNVGISLEGVYVIDVKEKHVLLGLRFCELSWDHSYPEGEGDSHILWLEFDGEEAGTPVNKLLKIYSKRAELMSGLIDGVSAGKLRRQSSVVCSRVHTLNTISYVDDGKEIKRLKPKRAASFFTRQAPPPNYSAVQVGENLEQGDLRVLYCEGWGDALNHHYVPSVWVKSLRVRRFTWFPAAF
ncbi:hypothetical protein SKAU_G00267570 [Synaphobranchus kaupii]|uniref:FERM domain-containing protein 8 n=1 Tax=Synaphobranchus kaupii TaxID=118154 RepID=A0A9Q1EZN5_SYNKA|nr:hypothetical protein SKAU_G00267570 [Synaphobranchus kaupii]